MLRNITINTNSNVTNSRFLNVVNDPILGTHSVLSINNNQITYEITGGENYTNPYIIIPESGYSRNVSYTTDSIYPIGGIATIKVLTPPVNQ